MSEEFDKIVDQSLKPEIDAPALKKMTIFTMTGCEHCEKALDEYGEEIDQGNIDVKNCDEDGTDEERANCQLALKQINFDGFPSIYAKDGSKLL